VKDFVVFRVHVGVVLIYVTLDVEVELPFQVLEPVVLELEVVM